MTTPTNDDRADDAEEALNLFAETTGLDVRDDDDYACALTDLLCNLMHLCKRNAMDFNIALSTAQMHFNAES